MQNKSINDQKPKNPFYILLAEDDFEMRKMLSWSLNKEGYNVVVCQDGNTLIKHLGVSNGFSPSKPFGLIISDIRMPGAYGLEILKIAKSINNFPPVIFITAFPDPEIIDSIEQQGATILSKPFDVDELLTKVRKVRGKDLFHLEFDKNIPQLDFPLNIAFRHSANKSYSKELVYQMASKLNCFSHYIENCLVVIDEDLSHEQPHNHIHVHIHVIMPGESIVARHKTNRTSNRENLHLAISDAFKKHIGWYKNI